MSCLIVPKDEFKKISTKLKEFYSVVEIRIDSNSNDRGVLYKINIENHNSNGLDEVYYHGLVIERNIQKVLDYFIAYARKDVSESEFKDLFHLVGHIELRDEIIPNSDFFKDVFLHYAKVLTDYADGIIDLDENYTYKNSKIHRSHFRDIDRFLGLLNELRLNGANDLELYLFFADIIYFEKFGREDFFVVNYRIGEVINERSRVAYFMVDQSWTLELRKITKVSENMIDEVKLISGACVEYIKHIAGYSANIEKIALSTSSPSEFKKQVINIQKDINGGGVSSFNGFSFNYVVGKNEMDFTLDVFGALVKLVSESSRLNDGYLNIPEIKDNYERSYLFFTGGDKDMWKITWEYIHNGYFSLKSNKEVMLSVSADDSFKMDKELLLQQEKLQGGGTLLDLM